MTASGPTVMVRAVTVLSSHHAKCVIKSETERDEEHDEKQLPERAVLVHFPAARGTFSDDVITPIDGTFYVNDSGLAFDEFVTLLADELLALLRSLREQLLKALLLLFDASLLLGKPFLPI